MNKPKNHHYVPQHFQRAWATNSDGLKINRYKWIEQRSALDFSPDYSIVRNASEHNLYTICDGKEVEEYETGIMTDQIDTPGSKVIQKLRQSDLKSLHKEDMNILSQYVVSLEARNPVVMKLMQLSDEDIDRMLSTKEIVASPEIISEIATLMKSINSIKYGTGSIASGAFASWGHKSFSDKLSNQYWLEVNTPNDQLITSNYPVGRFGDYEKGDFFACLSVSPRKALLFIPPNPNTVNAFKNASLTELVRITNLLSIYRANEAYSNFHTDELRTFIESHVWWKTRVPEENHRDYFQKVFNEVTYSKFESKLRCSNFLVQFKKWFHKFRSPE